MNLRFKINLLIAFLLPLLFGCNEKLHIDSFEQGVPLLTSFSPTSGQAGDEITVVGDQLRDVASATIGGEEATIKYKISQTQLVLEIPAGAKSGVIALTSPLGTATSSAEFTIVYPVPEITSFAKIGDVGAKLEVLGHNLSGISAFRFGDVPAAIDYQSSTELIVTIPFVLADEAELAFDYQTADGVQTQLLSGTFGIRKPQPAVMTTFPSRVQEGETILLEGSNLNLIEHVLVGDVEATISLQESDFLAFRIPTLPQTATVEIYASYYEATKRLVFSEACEVFIPQVRAYTDVEIGSHRNEIGNLLNATTGDVYTPCYLSTAATNGDAESLRSIDLVGYVNGSYSMTLYGPQATTGTLKNYWCSGKTFTKSTTLDALTAEGFGEFLATKTTFLVLSESNSAQLAIIEQVKAGTITKIAPETLPSLFDGTIVPTSTTTRSRSKTEAEGTQSTTIYKEGSVILFKNAVKDKIGLLLVKKVNVDYTQTTTVANASSSVVVDILLER